MALSIRSDCPGAFYEADPEFRPVEVGAVCESRSLFQCSEEGGGYFWRNASIPAAAYAAYVSKFEILSNPRVGNGPAMTHRRRRLQALASLLRERRGGSFCP